MPGLLFNNDGVGKMSSAKQGAIVFFLVLAGRSPSVLAQIEESAPPVFPGKTEGDFTIKGFHFNSGEVLPELRLHYVTIGLALIFSRSGLGL